MFLEESRAAAEQEVAESRRRAEREARTSRRLRGLLAGLPVVLVLALVAGGLALTLRGQAERQAVAGALDASISGAPAHCSPRTIPGRAEGGAVAAIRYAATQGGSFRR